MMTAVAYVSERVTPCDPWRDPYGSQARRCFPFTNPSSDPCDPYKAKTLMGNKGHRDSPHWERQPQRSGGYNGVLGVTGVTSTVLPIVYMDLRVTPCTGHIHANGSRLPRGGDVPTSGSLWGLTDAGIAEPRCFALKTKFEIENPFYRSGGFPATKPEDPTWKI